VNLRADAAGKQPAHKCQVFIISKELGDGPGDNRAHILKAHKLYMDKCYGKGARNDAVGMQYLIPGWVFDNKKPCMVR